MTARSTTHNLVFLTAIGLSVAFFAGCSFSYKIVPIKGTYSDGNFEAYSDKSKDVVWDNVIDFFAKKGLPIKIIDRSSGLIISEQTRMIYTRENAKGEIKNKDAWVVIHRVIDPNTKKLVDYDEVTAEWNVRLKQVDNRTLINVNLVNPKYTYVSGKETHFKKDAIQSTGVFEKTIYDIVK